MSYIQTYCLPRRQIEGEKLSKLNLIALIDMMSGLKEDECISLEKMSHEKVEKYYINHYQQQDDEQIQISYF